MKKLISLIIILTLYNCGSIAKEQLILDNNIKIVQKEYPKATIKQHRHFAYVFSVNTINNIFYVIVNNNGKIVKTNKIVTK